jgi:prenyltransferase beta subunit
MAQARTPAATFLRTRIPMLGQVPTADTEWSIRHHLESSYRFVESKRAEWSLSGNVDLEVLNHVLRVRIQDGTIDRHASDVLDLCAAQHEDGGWGDTRDDPNSQLRSTAFCTQMLLRANRSLHHATVALAVERAMAFIRKWQQLDGSWTDRRWPDLDATSVAVGTLLFYTREPESEPGARAALARGMEYVYARRHSDGLWYYKQTASPVTITAHLLQKCATHGGREQLVVESASALARLQHEEGHWDKGHVDHTCDALRCLLLCASVVADDGLRAKVQDTAGRAVDWLVQCGRDGGLGDRPGAPPHVERTCDGIDTLLKFQTFHREQEQLVKFWR